MDAGVHARTVRSLQREARFFRLASAVLAVAVAALAATVAASGLAPKRVVVVPAEVRTEFWVEEGRVSRGYFLEWGYFLASLILNVTPESVAYQNEVLLRHIDARHREGMRARLTAAAERLREDGLSTFFSVADVHVDPHGGQVAFVGSLSSYVEGRKVEERDAAYVARFRVGDSRLHLLEFAETRPDSVFEVVE